MWIGSSCLAQALHLHVALGPPWNALGCAMHFQFWPVGQNEKCLWQALPRLLHHFAKNSLLAIHGGEGTLAIYCQWLLRLGSSQEFLPNIACPILDVYRATFSLSCLH